jgi:hypothetical protein
MKNDFRESSATSVLRLNGALHKTNNRGGKTDCQEKFGAVQQNNLSAPQH